MKRITVCCQLILLSTVLSISAESQCRKAQADEVPHGANEFIIDERQVTSNLHGTVLFPDGKTAKNVVVEIYAYKGSDVYQEVEQTLREQKRLAACLTKRNGRFSFKNLKAGKYLLRAGTRDNAGINEVYVIVTLKSIPVKSKTTELQIILSLGT
jgi:hypothetical protein